MWEFFAGLIVGAVLGAGGLFLWASTTVLEPPDMGK